MNSIDLNNLTKGQKTLLKTYFQDDEHDIITWIGAIRSGKGVGAAHTMMTGVLFNYAKYKEPLNYILGGQTLGSFQRNNEMYLLDTAEQMGLGVRYVGDTKPHYSVSYKEQLIARMYVFGGDNKRSYLPVRGVTAKDAWIDEVTLCDEMFVQTVLERCSFGDSKLILTSNADKPSHWLKADWIDQEMEGITTMESDFDENFHYSDTRRKRLKALNPDTANYKRAIGNEWVGAEGQIIPILPEHIVSGTYAPTGIVVMDPGTASITAATLWQSQPDRTYVVVDEYYHKGDEAGRLEDREHIKRIMTRWNVLGVVCDPAGASMKAAWRKAGYTARNAKNDFEIGVQTTNNALYAGKIKISDTCKNLFREASGYVWRDTSETPVYTPDHLMDTLRYGAMQFFPRNSSGLLK